MRKGMVLAVTVMLTLTLILNYYIGFHALQWLKVWWPGVSPLAFWLVFGVVAYSYFIGRISWPKALNGIGRCSHLFGSYYLAVMEFSIILLPIADLLHWLLKQTGVSTDHYVAVAGGIILTILAGLLIKGRWNAQKTVIQTYRVQVDKTLKTMSQLRMAVVSDLHLGLATGNRQLKGMVEQINGLKPDLVLLVGDVIDDSLEAFIHYRMAEQLKELKATHGIYAVLGNHEYLGGTIVEYVKIMESIGIKVLQDETAEIPEGYYVVGRKDKTAESADPAGRKSVADLVSGLDLSRPVIMADHQPNRFDLAAEAGVDLLFCGHTHGGQFAPNHWVTRRIFELDWGYKLKGRMHVAVSCGYGIWGPPIRLGSHSEIIEMVVDFLP